MKKLIILLLVCVLSISLVGCGSDSSTDAERIGDKAIETIDDYMNYDITADEASEKLDLMADDLTELYDNEFDDEELKSSYLWMGSSCRNASWYITSGDYTELKEIKSSIESDLKN